MTGVKVSCPYCSTEGPIPAHSILETTHTRHPEMDTYQFKCLACGHMVNRPATASIKELLHGSGCRRQHVHIPDEADDPIRYGGCRDDLLDALTELQGDITCPTN